MKNLCHRASYGLSIKANRKWNRRKAQKRIRLLRSLLMQGLYCPRSRMQPKRTHILWTRLSSTLEWQSQMSLKNKTSANSISARSTKALTEGSLTNSSTSSKTTMTVSIQVTRHKSLEDQMNWRQRKIRGLLVAPHTSQVAWIHLYNEKRKTINQRKTNLITGL